MINRSLVAAIVASAALFTVSATLTSGVDAAAAQKFKKPALGAKSVTPKKLPGYGGPVAVKVKVKDPSNVVTKVESWAEIPKGAVGQRVSLALGANGYEGTVAVPANDKTKKADANVFVQVFFANAKGVDASLKAKVGVVKLDGYTVGADDSTPPPPPDLPAF